MFYKQKFIPAKNIRTGEIWKTKGMLQNKICGVYNIQLSDLSNDGCSARMDTRVPSGANNRRRRQANRDIIDATNYFLRNPLVFHIFILLISYAGIFLCSFKQAFCMLWEGTL